mmetsp:Transcript_26914/g.41022  ORF Transcript_26914/g.41022 Transcript_26914/m.41022 type:complete len:118 (+) Transcript_26914:173-526(+)
MSRKFSEGQSPFQQDQNLGSELATSSQGPVQRFTVHMRKVLNMQSTDPRTRAMTYNVRGERISERGDSTSLRRQGLNELSIGDEFIMGEREFAQSYASISHFKSQSSQVWGSTIHHK